MTYLNLIGQTNASIESVPGTSQPHIYIHVDYLILENKNLFQILGEIGYCIGGLITDSIF